MARLFDDAQSEYLDGTPPVVEIPCTMACWANNDLDSDRDFFALWNVSDTNYCILAFNSSGGGDHLRSFQKGADAAAITPCVVGDVWPLNEWHHACGVFSATNARSVFFDGGNKGTDATEVGATDGFSTVEIGRFSTSYWSGMIAEAAIWNVALTDAEVAILAKGYSPLFVRPQSLVAYWPLIRDEDQDRVGGYDLTPVNGPSIAVHPPVIYPAPRAFYMAAAGAPSGVASRAIYDYRRRRV